MKPANACQIMNGWWLKWYGCWCWLGHFFSSVQVNEYSALKDSVLYSWAELSPGSFFLRLGGLWMVTFTVLAAPIAAASFNPGKVPNRFFHHRLLRQNVRETALQHMRWDSRVQPQKWTHQFFFSFTTQPNCVSVRIVSLYGSL